MQIEINSGKQALMYNLEQLIDRMRYFNYDILRCKSLNQNILNKILLKDSDRIDEIVIFRKRLNLKDEI